VVVGLWLGVFNVIQSTVVVKNSKIIPGTKKTLSQNTCIANISIEPFYKKIPVSVKFTISLDIFFHHQYALCEHFIAWQIVSALKLGHNQAMI
jgi:hypothetical protein